ncbi:hypothetical protein FNV43_RR06175 [Rhamnella rubrinervis]|uniref:S-adenosylmethionine-dependent methyltransferase n=1 Tax=Rhamnella rubrinervis TaxID=2594499 RepID=A0A8K0MLQ7_9ROSA|nr:hypothetical protein FNV43_RR06175 [Rhamnella rubrinervis]
MEPSEAYPMKGGDGLHSYAKNSTFQGEIIDVAKEFINETIAEKLDIGALDSPKTFSIADLGCSVGPNTFTAVGNIVEAVKSKYQSQSPEFHVFFNDHISNDFNMLFASLPHDKQYYAAGVPGSFYGRIFPEASLHFVHSSSSLQWLSRVPKEVMIKNSSGWNKGRIHFTNSGDEVIRAYQAQHEKDMEKFLQARALEVVHGGLMVLIFAFKPNGAHPSQCLINLALDLVGSSLMDLVKKGIVDEEKVDSFNLPIFFMSPQEVEAAVERNGCFSIVRMEILLRRVQENNNGNGSFDHQLAANMRAGLEGIIRQNFGDNIIDELFDLYNKKMAEVFTPSMAESVKGLFVALERKS